MAQMSVADLLRDLRLEIPEIGPLIDGHLETFGQVLPHVLFGDVTRFAVDAHAAGWEDVEGRCLCLLERALTDGDAEVVNVIEVSFIENVGPWDNSVREWIATWPARLQAAADRQGGLVRPITTAHLVTWP